MHSGLINSLSHPDVQVELEKDLIKFSTMHLVATGTLITVRTIDGLKNTLKIFSEKKIIYQVLGWGANTLLPSKSSIPYIHLDFEFNKNQLESPKDEYILPASISLATLTSHANKFGLKGWEVFTGIPASLGGAIFMNAGTNLGEIGNLVKEVKIITKEGAEKLIEIDKNSFSYRKNHFINPGDIVVEARLIHFGIDEAISKKIRDYLEMRNRTQPLKESTCGCVFKNHETCLAGKSIDIMGLKGFTYKNLQVSSKHANFMENKGGSSYIDVVEMINILKAELKLQYGVAFETEVEF
jgi:UDP-N-acetylmuramate dehydrogenase